MSNARIMRDALRQRYGNKPLGALLKAHADEFNDGSFNVRGLFPSLYEESFVAAERRYWQEFDILNESTAFWRAADYSGSGVVADGSGNGHDLTNNGATFLPYSGSKYVYFPGVGGNYVFTPDAPELDITGDMDLRVYDVVSPSWSGVRRALLTKAPGGGSDSFAFTVDTTGALELFLTSTGAGLSAVTVPGGLVNGQQEDGLRVTYRQSDRRVQFFRLDSGEWVQVGADQTHTATSIFSGTGTLEIGGRVAAPTQEFLGNIGRAEVRNGIDGPIVASWSAEDMGQTGGTSGGRTWTINRAASGRKSVLVDRPLFLLGTDDYLETPDAADLDFGAADSFSVVTVFRQHHNPGTSVGAYIAKAPSSQRGWRLWQWSGDQGVYFTINDGTVNAQDWQGAAALSVASVRAGVRDVSADTLKSYVDGVASATTADTTTGTLANVQAVRIGSDPGSTSYSDREFMGAAVFRRALTDAEIALVGRALGSD